MHAVVALVAALSLAACSSKTPPKETGSAQPKQEERIAVPGSKTDGAPNFGGPGGAEGASRGGAIAGAGNKLTPDEGQLSIEAPAEAKAGAEATAKVVLKPGANYKVNTEFPTQLTIETPAGVTIAKTQLKAGGPDKEKGDAEAFSEKELAFAVKLTPGAAGNVTINGTIKFAVCDKDTCLPKKEPVTIAFAAK